jgi:hypothetical protein
MAMTDFYSIVIVRCNLMKHWNKPKLSAFSTKTIRGHKTRYLLACYTEVFFLHVTEIIYQDTLSLKLFLQ